MSYVLNIIYRQHPARSGGHFHAADLAPLFLTCELVTGCFMGRLSDAGAKAMQRFAVYCGDGVYVRRAMGRAQMLDKHGICGVDVEMGPSPIPMRRAEAVQACKAARELVAGAWIVPHGGAA